ncbi:SDR family NAD(P)-dependent oxidoreductase [Paenibacillus koleovorans]|uniref:SDR family NAD(P)-dependent oxidoreductase n=1 Tax=Paenibacillus koleovorans TaxID=121608 RepID=UPI000FDA5BB3|nr:3-oxoacyl-ACP reductase family protein [Paenibacillus koleovorans]
MKLQGKVAVVTGAARSIGAAVAKRYAREGAKVAIVDRSFPEQAALLVEEITQLGGEAAFYQTDISDETQVMAMMDQAASRFGTIDILVNNAAVDPRKAWHEISTEEWDRVMGINARGPFLCAKAAFPYMKQQGYGKIVNVTSVTFYTGQRNFLHYVSSKGAVIGFTRALAREVGAYGITVNCISPGAVKTESEEEKVDPLELEKAESALLALQCFQRRELASDIVGAFVFLASPDSDFISGQTLNVDGGWMFH